MEQLSRYENRSCPKHQPLGSAVCVGLALLVALSLGSYRADAETDNIAGPGGQFVAGSLVSFLGLSSWLVVWALWRYARWQLRKRDRAINAWQAVPSVAAGLFACGSLHVTQQLFPSLRPFGHALAGGHVGAWIGGGLIGTFGTVGSALMCAGVVAYVLMRVGRVDAEASIDRLHGFARRHGYQLVNVWRRSGELLRERLPAPVDEEVFRAPPQRPAKRAERRRAPERVVKPIPLLQSGCARDVNTTPFAVGRLEPSPAQADVVDATAETSSSEEDCESPTSSVLSTPAVYEHARKLPGVFTLPRARLLAAPPPRRAADRTLLDKTAQRLVEKLSALGIEGAIEHVKPGRVVTMFQFKPPPSVKVSAIAELGDDLSLALEADGVRVIAPLPGTARIGIEVPNQQRADIYLRELVEGERWVQHPGVLPLALGIDVENNPVYADLAEMPHLLVAGATGAGKSVGLNAMLLSLLLRHGPADLRFILIDPKFVELTPFNDIPHLLQPVVTDMMQATRVLDWVVEEMDRRYQLLAKVGARNLKSYNAHVEKQQRSSPPEPISNEEDGGEPLEKLPYLVVVIDEVADLMMVAGKSFPQLLMRLAQKSRAAGIHAIIATQRPSVKVITGDIKANLPARIAYKVAQREDSKTILGRVGAEMLLGRGDMLCNMPNEKALKRVHGPFVSDEDVKAVCDFLRTQSAPSYGRNDAIAAAAPLSRDSGCDLSAEDAALYDRAVEHVAAAGRCSGTMLQTALGIGWPKAAKLVQWLEKEGVVGPAPKGSNTAREVYVRPR